MGGISDMAECGRGLLFVGVYDLFFYVTDRVWMGGTLSGCGERLYGCCVERGWRAGERGGHQKVVLTNVLLKMGIIMLETC
jgi:hypothetical protein